MATSDRPSPATDLTLLARDRLWLPPRLSLWLCRLRVTPWDPLLLLLRLLLLRLRPRDPRVALAPRPRRALAPPRVEATVDAATLFLRRREVEAAPPPPVRDLRRDLCVSAPDVRGVRVEYVLAAEDWMRVKMAADAASAAARRLQRKWRGTAAWVGSKS